MIKKKEEDRVRKKRGTSRGGRVSELKKRTIATKGKKKERKRELGVKEETARRKTKNKTDNKKKRRYQKLVKKGKRIEGVQAQRRSVREFSIRSIFRGIRLLEFLPRRCARGMMTRGGGPRRAS